MIELTMELDRKRRSAQLTLRNRGAFRANFIQRGLHTRGAPMVEFSSGRNMLDRMDIVHRWGRSDVRPSQRFPERRGEEVDAAAAATRAGLTTLAPADRGRLLGL